MCGVLVPVQMATIVAIGCLLFGWTTRPVFRIPRPSLSLGRPSTPLKTRIRGASAIRTPLAVRS